MLKILFVTSEAHPLMKTGGLGDVCGGLPAALAARGHDVRLVHPAYRETLDRIDATRVAASLAIPGTPGRVDLHETTLPGGGIKTWLVDYGPAFDRAGNPYLDAAGQPWPDNAERFALFARAAVSVARDRADLDWLPDVVHCHDWQTGLVPALLSLEVARPATVFTIHNLAYQGLFPASSFGALGLPPILWSMHALEYHGQLSFIKGGLAFADRLTTVSPTYAREIQTPAFGCGLDGLLRSRAGRLGGILNGADYATWDPAHDPHLAWTYDTEHLPDKSLNKTALQAEFELPVRADTALIGMVGRLVEQKGVDLVLAALPELLKENVQLAIVGTGERRFEQALMAAAARHPERIAVRVEYSERLAHLIEAGADMFLMPSRFEPCGLNQLYSLRYGTVPIVRRTGGLADSVVDATPENLKRGTATGLIFDAAAPKALLAAVKRGLELFGKRETWDKLMVTGMRQDFGWRKSAEQYLELYERALRDCRPPPTGAAPPPRQGAKEARSAQTSTRALRPPAPE